MCDLGLARIREGTKMALGGQGLLQVSKFRPTSKNMMVQVEANADV